MILKKQLSNTRVDFQRMGVLGAVAVVHVLSDPEFVGDDVSNNLELSEAAASLTANDSSCSGILTGDQRLKQAKAIIDMVTSFTFRIPEVAALFMDEMASSVILYDVHASLSAYLNDLVLDTFQVIEYKDSSHFKFLIFSVFLVYRLGEFCCRRKRAIYQRFEPSPVFTIRIE